MPLLHQMYFQGRWERDYLLYLPVNYQPNPAHPIPLLIALHGGGGHAQGMIKLTQEGFHRLADEYRFAVAYPNGIGRQWNDGRFEMRGGRQIDDVGFMRELIDLLSGHYSLDRERVYVTGISNGGHMAYRLASDIPDRIAGIAAVAALMPAQLALPSRPVPMLTIHGTDDPLVPYKGGAVQVGMLQRGAVRSAMETLRVWAEANRCGGEPSTELLDDVDPSDRMSVQRTLYRDCMAPVVLYTVIGGGHTWPGGWQYLGERMIGKTSRDIDACQVIWEFFRGLSDGQ